MQRKRPYIVVWWKWVVSGKEMHVRGRICTLNFCFKTSKSTASVHSVCMWSFYTMTTNSWLSLSFFVEIHKSNNLRKHKGMYFSFVLSVCTERSKLDAVRVTSSLLCSCIYIPSYAGWISKVYTENSTGTCLISPSWRTSNSIIPDGA